MITIALKKVLNIYSSDLSEEQRITKHQKRENKIIMAINTTIAKYKAKLND